MVDDQRRTAAGGSAALVALLLAAPSPGAAAASLAAEAGADPTGPLVAAVALLAWAVAGWLVLTVVVVLLSRLPGLLGRTARAAAGRIAPRAVRRTVEAALGLTVVAGVLTPAAAGAAPVAGPSPAVVLGAGTAWDLDWPSRARPAAPTLRPPTPTTAPAATAPVPPRSTTSPPARPPAAVPRAAAAARPSPARPAAGAVVVQAGDSLWSLAEASLRSTGTAAPSDRQVAQAWPRWWAANREVVGDDPDLLLPGTVLRPPGDPR